jgi:hypothetical protein
MRDEVLKTFISDAELQLKAVYLVGMWLEVSVAVASIASQLMV